MFDESANKHHSRRRLEEIPKLSLSDKKEKEGTTDAESGDAKKEGEENDDEEKGSQDGSEDGEKGSQDGSEDGEKGS